MTFFAQGDRVFWRTEGGPYELNREGIDGLLAIYDANHAARPWLELDQAARDAGYPGSVSSSRAIREAMRRAA